MTHLRRLTAALFVLSATCGWLATRPAHADTGPPYRIIYVAPGTDTVPTDCPDLAPGGFSWDTPQQPNHPTPEPAVPRTIGPYPLGSTLTFWICGHSRGDVAGSESYGEWHTNQSPRDTNPNSSYDQPPCDRAGCEGFAHAYNTAGTFDFWAPNTGYRVTVQIGDVPSTTTSSTATPATTQPPATTTAVAPPTTVAPARLASTAATMAPNTTTTTAATIADTTTTTVDTSTTAPTGQVAISQEPPSGGSGIAVPVAGGVGVLSLAGVGAWWWRKKRLV